VDDGEKCDRARDGRQSLARWGLDGDQLAAGGGVDDVPPALLKLRPDRISGGEIALAASLDARLEEL